MCEATMKSCAGREWKVMLQGVCYPIANDQLQHLAHVDTTLNGTGMLRQTYL